jgi:hypothetical protein
LPIEKFETSTRPAKNKEVLVENVESLLKDKLKVFVILLFG